VKNVILVLLVMAVPMLWVPDSVGAETPKNVNAAEAAKRRTGRERQFLYRMVEDLNRSQGYVQAAVRGLERQINAVDILESSRRDKDIGSFLDWYHSYAEWLGNNLVDLEADLSRSYSDERGAIVQPERCYSLIDGYARLGAQLGEQVSHLDKLDDRTIQRIAGLRTSLEYVMSGSFIEERNREKKQPPLGNDRRKDELYERYKDTTDIEIAMMQRELKNLDELQKHFLVLLELGRMEQSWISRKTGDYDALARLAVVVGGDAPGPVEEAINRVIKLYESDITYFKRKAGDIASARSRVIPAGSLKILDRMEELSENYDQMEYRYERHISWLAEQSGAYRADIIELRKDR